MIVPQYKRPEESKSVDFATTFLVSHNEHPIFFLEVKASDHINHISTRGDADKQMRERFKKVFDEVKVDILYGVSAIGTRFCVYQVNAASGYIEPEAIPEDPIRVTDTAPAARWDLDVMTVEGRKRLLEVVGHIKTMCEQL
ncbi:hypothetical protein BGX38DRAFT_1232645 [Terfezia claveryi]|nr:hypothetical protein BGX38DRAFT_1232645 [Terfezia claveryi]